MQKFSVLCSIYHKDKAIDFDECMESLWDNQTLKPDEIVLVKDGPLTPELDKVINLWHDKLLDKFKIITLEENVGTGRAKNIGLEKCSHELVCIMDTDDICTPDRFSKLINFMTENPDTAICGGQIAEFIDQPKNYTSIRRVPLEHKDIYKYAKKYNPFNHVSIIYKKSIIEKVGGYKHHLFMEDYNLILRVLASGYKTANLPDLLVYVRTSNGMIQRRKGLIYIKSEWQLFKLKHKLHFQNTLSAFTLFLLRASMRLLPTSLLKVIYTKILREK